MRKHGRHTHVHPLGSGREMAPAVVEISRAAALRSVGEVVYAALVGGVVKIGHTTDLANRLHGLGADELLAFAPGSYADEQAIHARLTEHLHHGREWYYPTPGVMVVVNELRTVVGLDSMVA